ncbi:MAG: hypothetical protein ED559_08805 [Phycisphaera sp.]|nr:MAG: hypothetical protein ED559_08805 [Phycisphaera sp.]
MLLCTLAETDFIMFWGRLHPLFVHLPIGMVAALVIVEAMTIMAKPEYVSATRKLLIWMTAISAILSSLAGWFLAGEGGYSESLLFWHRWLGIAFAAVLLVGAAISLTPKWSVGLLRAGVLGAAVVLMTITGHMGGTMTHGESYLSKYAPPLLANLLGPSETAEPIGPVETTAVSSDAQIVMEMLEARCVECHGASKQKGRLRLDTPEGIAGVLTEGDPAQSELFRRISLPADDFDIMPPEGEVIRDEEVLAVMRWIRDGAVLSSSEFTDDGAKVERGSP